MVQDVNQTRRSAHLFVFVSESLTVSAKRQYDIWFGSTLLTMARFTFPEAFQQNILAEQPMKSIIQMWHLPRSLLLFQNGVPQEVSQNASVCWHAEDRRKLNCKSAFLGLTWKGLGQDSVRGIVLDSGPVRRPVICQGREPVLISALPSTTLFDIFKPAFLWVNSIMLTEIAGMLRIT